MLRTPAASIRSNTSIPSTISPRTTCFPCKKNISNSWHGLSKRYYQSILGWVRTRKRIDSCLCFFLVNKISTQKFLSRFIQNTPLLHMATKPRFSSFIFTPSLSSLNFFPEIDYQVFISKKSAHLPQILSPPAPVPVTHHKIYILAYLGCTTKGIGHLWQYHQSVQQIPSQFDGMDTPTKFFECPWWIKNQLRHLVMKRFAGVTTLPLQPIT